MADKIPYTDITDQSPNSSVKKMPKKSAARDKNSDLGKQSIAAKLYAEICSGKIYTKRVTGFFQKMRRYMNALLVALFLVLPWLEVEQRPAVLFDLEGQKFHVFSMTFWPQDGVFLVYLLVLASFLLIAATLVIGRAWCGFTCPQTVWTFLFMWVEDKCEGDRNQRIKLDGQDWGISKVLRKSSKHTIWMIISLITAYTFVGYFYELPVLVADTLSFEMHYLGVFWIIFFTSATYLNGGWLREKVCMHMCPYARLQAVMYTQGTLVVSYDSERGESRGKRKKDSEEYNSQLGDCVDCSLCVQVCPVDIDIRDGLQYPCIDCGLCIDACDKVMKKVGFETGLIRFSSSNQNAKKSGGIKRAGVWGLAVISIAACVAFGFAIDSREPLSIDVIRDRNGVLYQRTDQGVTNSYQVKINNIDHSQKNFRLSLIAQEGFSIIGSTKVHVAKGQVDTLVVRVLAEDGAVSKYKTAFKFAVHVAGESQVLAEQSSSLIAPM
jgi:cytochrome c oxidase accessory protein FixG